MKGLLYVSLCLIIFTACKRSDIVSWCEADVGVVVITGGGVREDGRRYGDTLKIFAHGVLPEIEGGETPFFEKDLTDIKPLKVQAGDVTGDGVQEISVTVYKLAEFHPVLAERPFFYRFEDNELVPVWLGSRLARPFDDYVLGDIDGDGIDEIIAIENLQDGDKIVCAYDWKGFGFEELARTEPFPKALEFVSPFVVRHKGDGEYALKLSKGENPRIEVNPI